MSNVNKISTGYVPRAFQEEMHRNRKRFNVLCLHRRSGKSIFCINDMIDMALRNNLKNPQYAYLAPYHGQVKRLAWEYVKTYSNMLVGVAYNEAELRLTIPRPDRGDKITIYLLGADNPTALRGLYLDGCVLDEVSEMDPQVWTQVLRPALSDRLGWAIFASTPKGENFFYELLQIAKKNESGEWYYKILKASESGLIAEKELQEARQVMSEPEYLQEFEVSFTSSLIGSYYGTLMEQAEKDGRITSVPYEPSVPVQTAFDLGVSDTTCIFYFQQVGREIRCIDYDEDAGHGLPHYAELLRKKGYSYDEYFMPHDISARDLSTGRSRQETFRSLGVHPITIIPRQSIEDRINASRLLIPKVWFDAKKCERGIRALKSYERKWDPKNKIFLSSPLHNWASNGADAFGTYALGYRDLIKNQSRKDLPRQTESDYDILS